MEKLIHNGKKMALREYCTKAYMPDQAGYTETCGQNEISVCFDTKAYRGRHVYKFPPNIMPNAVGFESRFDWEWGVHPKKQTSYLSGKFPNYRIIKL